MTVWERLMNALSVPALILLAAGVVLMVRAAKLSRLLFRDRGEAWIMPMRIAGLLLVALAVVILLHLIPGL